MNKQFARGLVAVAGLAGVVNVATAQTAAPTASQRWEQRFLIERFASDGVTLLSSTFNTDPINYNTLVGVGRVDITYQLRVGILTNTTNTRNLGVSRGGGAGGATSGFRLQFVDAVSQSAGLNQGTLARAVSSGTATGGVPSTGLFKEFRGVLAGWSAAANASNTDVNNGGFFNNTTSDTNAPVLANIVGGRTQNFGDGVGGDLTDDLVDGALATARTGGVVGAATINGAGLDGEFANYYKVSYFPRADFSTNPSRLVRVNEFAASGRYLFNYTGNGNASNGGNNNFTDQSFSFAVPTPGAAALVGLGGLAALRRRRA